jgi:hypothetical protein
VPGRSRTVAPPAGGPGADDVGRIDEQHADKDRAAGLVTLPDANKCSTRSARLGPDGAGASRHDPSC